MGCKSTKIVPIEQSVDINALPVELIYKILDELDISTIMGSLYHVCKRFDEILSTYDQYHVDLKSTSLTTLKFICSRLRPEQVTKLTLSDAEINAGLVPLLLSRFPIHRFVRLRSLSLIQIDQDEVINQVLISIADPTSFLEFSSIEIIHSDESYGDLFSELLTSVLAKPSVRRAYFDLSYSRTTSNPIVWLQQSSVRHLTFKGACTINFVRDIFSHAPYLQTFITDDFDFDDEVDLNNLRNRQDEESDADTPDEIEEEEDEALENNVDLLPKKEKFNSIDPSNHLTSLTLSICTVTMSKLEWLLQEMSTLKRFSLVTTAECYDQTILDGQRWTTLLSNIDHFQFIFSINISDSLPWSTDECLATFQTPFWLEEKRWFVSLEKYNDEVLLYTLPYLNDFYVTKDQSSAFEYHSTASEYCQSQAQAMKNVRDLYIDVSNFRLIQLKNCNLPRFCHVTQLFLYGKWPKSTSLLSELQTFLNLNTIEELNRDEYIPTLDFIELLKLMPNLHSLRTTPNLLDSLNAARFCHRTLLHSLTVNPICYGDQRCVNIEPFCAMFPRVAQLSIPVDHVDSCQYVLEQLKADLISVIFRIPTDESLSDQDDNENNNWSDDNDDENDTARVHPTGDPFTDWIKDLSKLYRCYRKQQLLHISLK